MPKISKGYKRNILNVSSRTRIRIIQLQNQDAQFMRTNSENNSFQSVNFNNLPISSYEITISTGNCINNTIYYTNLSSETNIYDDNLTIDMSQFLPIQTNISLKNNRTNSINDFETFKTEKKNWAVNCRIAQCHLNALLTILRKYEGFKMLPKDSRTLLQTPNVSIDKIRLVNSNGKYFYFGLTESLLKYYSCINNITN